nr:hypothetical protein [Nitrosomonas nitrosa]
MSTASRKRSNATRASSLIDTLYREVTALARATRLPTSERAMAAQLDALADATMHLAGAPATNLAEVGAKLIILCARLREDLHPEIGGELITYLLAESIREDCRVLVEGGGDAEVAE